MERKDFIKRGCQACILGTAAFLLPQMMGCSPATYAVFKTEEVNKKLYIPLQLFEKSKLQLVRPKGWQYDIAVQKLEENKYSALLMQCTHAENQLTPSQNGYSCSLHGSRFNAEGKVIKGPAEVALKKFNVILEQSNLIILT
jgi:Rieske Fe-S protein